MPKGEARLRTAEGLLNQIGERVKKHRTVLRMTQDRLSARLADVTGAHWNAHRHEVIAIENGSRAVTTVELIAIANALDVSPSWLLLGESVDDVTTSLPDDDHGRDGHSR